MTGRVLLSILALVLLLPRPSLTVTFLDVGRGNSIWMHLPSGDDILVDGGRRSAGLTIVAYPGNHSVPDIHARRIRRSFSHVADR